MTAATGPGRPARLHTPGPAVPRRTAPPAVRLIAEALEERLDVLVEATLESILAEVPVYRERGASVADDTRRAAAYVYASFVEMLRSGRAPGESVARSLANVGADRAAQGIPLGDLLQAFRVSGRIAAEALHDLVDERDLDRDAALWVAEAIVLWMDVVSNLAARDHSRAQARILSENEERRRGFVLDLLYGGVSVPAALERAETVGWDPAPPHWIAVAGRADASDSGRDAETALAGAVPLGFVAATRGDLVVVAPAHTAADAADAETAVRAVAAELGLLLGLTRPQAGLDGIRRAFLEAAEALTIARATGERAVHHEDALLDRLLRRDPELLAELVHRTMGPLIDYDKTRSTDLVTTLQAYVAESESPTRTAAVLHTHPQTVRYRLNRINEISGFSFDDPAGRLHLLVGLRGLRFLSRASL